MAGNNLNAGLVPVLGLIVAGCSLIRPIDVEIVPEREPEWRAEIAAITVELQTRRQSLQNGDTLRGVHPKSQGCVKADFIVNSDIGAEYRVGLFKNPGKKYTADIRYSNAAVLVLPDLDKGMNGSRGMAIKVYGVDGDVLFTDDGKRNQDFLMINTPEFAFGNVRDYLRLSRALQKSDDASTPDLFFLPLELLKKGAVDRTGKLNPPTGNETALDKVKREIFSTSKVFEGFSPEDMAGTLQSISVVGNIKSKTVRNPLQIQYHGASPFRFGRDRVMKFSVSPIGGEVAQRQFSDQEKKKWQDFPNYLARALKATLIRGDAVWLSFKVQIATALDLKGREKDLIENAAKAWDEDKFPLVEVARIKILPVEKDANLRDACKSRVFTPWHALEAHEPLGGINRLRKPVYNVSAECRRDAGTSGKGSCQTRK